LCLKKEEWSTCLQVGVADHWGELLQRPAKEGVRHCLVGVLDDRPQALERAEPQLPILLRNVAHKSVSYFPVKTDADPHHGFDFFASELH
jgi:hypothetical protein